MWFEAALNFTGNKTKDENVVKKEEVKRSFQVLIKRILVNFGLPGYSFYIQLGYFCNLFSGDTVFLAIFSFFLFVSARNNIYF